MGTEQSKQKGHQQPDRHPKSEGRQSARPPAFQLKASGKKPGENGSGSGGGKSGLEIQLGGTEIILEKDTTLTKIAGEFLGDTRRGTEVAKANGIKGGVFLDPTFKKGEKVKLPKVALSFAKLMEGLNPKRDSSGAFIQRLPKDEFMKMIQQLPQKDWEKYGEKIQSVLLVMNSGRTFGEMVKVEEKFLDARDGKKGNLRKQLDGMAVSKKKGKKTAWDVMSKESKQKWQDKFNNLLKDDKLYKSAPKNVQQVWDMAKKNGGGKLIFAPREVELEKAFAYTNDDWNLYVGFWWVELANKQPEKVMTNILHEMGGHNEYGTSQTDTLARMVSENAGVKDQDDEAAISSKLSYAETEIWADLREDGLPHEQGTPEAPFSSWESTWGKNHTSCFKPGAETNLRGAVVKYLKILKKDWAPEIVEPLIKSMWIRAQHDKRITNPTRARFKAAIQHVFPKVKL